MTTFTELNEVQSFIYNRSNLRRAFEGFDDSDISGIYLHGDDVVVVRNDGNEESYNKKKVQEAFTSFTHRLTDFFAYLGPNYRSPSIWHRNSYIMFKGWHYQHQLGKDTFDAKLQREWADKFIRITNIEKIQALLQSDQTNIGHLIAPDGLWDENQTVQLNDELVEEPSESNPVSSRPYCSCGSFQRQLNNLSAFSDEIEGFTPWCKHLTWFHKCREFQVKRADLITAARGNQPEKCCAWWYAPPSDGNSTGRFVVFHTKYGAQAPESHWRPYKPDQLFTQHDAWGLFFSMMEAGYTPYAGHALPQFSRRK